MHSEFDAFFDRSLFLGHRGGGFGLPSISMNVGPPESSPFSEGSRGAWAAESFVTSSINGVTQSIRKRRDWDGNEHVTRTFPDGIEVHTINGVEQPHTSRAYIGHHSGPELHYPSRNQPQITGPRSAAPPPPTYPPPPYPGHSTHASAYENPPVVDPGYGRHRQRTHSDTRPVIPEPYSPSPGQENRRKRWWPGGR